MKELQRTIIKISATVIVCEVCKQDKKIMFGKPSWFGFRNKIGIINLQSWYFYPTTEKHRVKT